jgi:predicted outer membrane repeat protein
LLSALQVAAANISFEGNTASRGGGIAASTASYLGLRSCSIEYNNASKHGGGIALYEEAELFVDPDSTMIANNDAGGYGGGILAVSSAFAVDDLLSVLANNTARYDSDVSVDVASIELLGNVSIAEFVSRPGAGEGVLPVRLNISGHYGLPCEGIVVAAALGGMYTLGTSTSDADGMVNIILRIQQPPGDYNITFKLVDYLAVSPAVLQLHIRNCTRGEVAPTPDTCQVCAPGSYSLHSSQETCQPCPIAGASCPGGAAILPLPGWWHSAADSAQMHR